MFLEHHEPNISNPSSMPLENQTAKWADSTIRICLDSKSLEAVPIQSCWSCYSSQQKSPTRQSCRYFPSCSQRHTWGIQSSEYCHFELSSACSERIVPQEVYGCSSVSDSHFQEFSPVFDVSSRTGQYSFRAVERSILDLAPSVILVCQCSIDRSAGTLIPHLTRPMKEA